MSLDADDYVHQDIVGTALEIGAEFGCLATTGYALDLRNSRIAPVPGAWSVDLDRVCGSTAIIRYDREDIPLAFGEKGVFDCRQHHTYARSRHDEYMRPLSIIPFPSVIYVLNTGENHSLVTRVGADGILENVRRHAITSQRTLEEIDDAFGTALAAAHQVLNTKTPSEVG